MIAKILKYDKHPSKHGGDFYYIFFKDKTGKSAKTCAATNMRNFNRWKQVLWAFDRAGENEEVWLKGLVWKNKTNKLISADSLIERIYP